MVRDSAIPRFFKPTLAGVKNISLFTPEELEFANLDAAMTDSIESSNYGQSENDSRCETSAANGPAVQNRPGLDRRQPTGRPKKARACPEVAQWLVVWLQNPQIFTEWLALRQNTAEFRERFLS